MIPTSPRDAAHGKAMTNTAFNVRLTDAADADLANISDAHTREVILRRAFELRDEPLKKGKPLTEELKGFRSIRAAGQRYRIVYQVAVADREVIVVVVGIRKAGDKKDVYEVATKRLT